MWHPHKISALGSRLTCKIYRLSKLAASQCIDRIKQQISSPVSLLEDHGPSALAEQ
jgi:hypothetical protein